MNKAIATLLMVLFLAGASSSWAQGPSLVILDFEDPALEEALTTFDNPTCSVVTGFASQGKRSLKAVFDKYEPGDPQWPACRIDHRKLGAAGDWRGYTDLVMSLHVESAAGVLLKIIVASGQQRARVNACTIEPGEWRTLRIPLDDTNEAFDWSAVDSVRLVLTRPPHRAVIHVDDLRLTAPDFSEARSTDWTLVTPSYHHGFFHTKEEDSITVRWETRLGAVPLRNACLRFTLERGEGQVIATEEVAVSAAASGCVRFDRPAIKDGESVVLTMTGVADGKDRWKRSMPITQYPPASAKEVTLRDDGVTLVDGKPFFPLAMYSAPASEFAYLRSMGCNTVHSYAPVDANYMTAAGRVGLMVLPRVTGRADSGSHIYHDPRRDGAAARSYVSRLKDSPALLGYYLFDEPNPGVIPRDLLLALCDFYRQADPHHLAAGCNNSYQSSYYRVSDAMMVDSYPIPGPMDSLIARTSEGAAAQKPAAALWFIAQAFNWETHFSGPLDGGKHGRRRLPTFDEMRTMPWLAVALGAKGIFYYSFQTQGFYHKNAFPWFWHGVECHVAETAALLPWLTEREPAALPTCNRKAILIAARKRGADWLVVAANPSRKRVSARITFPGLAGRALHVVSENRKIRSIGDVVTDVLGPMETHIYVSQLEPALAALPTLDEIRAEVRRREEAFWKENPSVFTYRDGARLYASWRFPDHETFGRKIWYRMIDGYPGTQWIVGRAYRHPDPASWKEKDFISPGRWIEVRIDQARPINRLRAVTSAETAFDLQLPDGDSWKTVPTEMVEDKPSRHHQIKTTTTTASFPLQETDRFRLLFNKPKQAGEAILELSAWRE